MPGSVGPPIFVLLGAGASYDSLVQPSDVDRPPLTPELFSHPRAMSTLIEYPLALNAAPLVQDAISGPEPASSLEDYLRTQLADSSDIYDQRRLLSIELYLQDLLLSFADQADFADNYRRLINPLLATHKHVCFITLNYDVLLDACLRPFDPLDEIGDFIRHERWSLIKAHGSATWGRAIPRHAGPGWSISAPEEVFESPPATLRDVLDQEIKHSWETDVVRVRATSQEEDALGRFPALSVPLGSKDELVCPREHLDFLAGRLEEVGAYDLLVIGYSGLDESVLDMLTGTTAKPKSVYVVDSGFEGASNAARRLAAAFGDTLKTVKTVSTATGESRVDITGAGPIAWHADHRTFADWVTTGPGEYRLFAKRAA